MRPHLTIPQEPMRIRVAEGIFVLVDACLYDWLNQWRWCLTNSGYACRRPRGQKTIYMHRLIMNASGDQQVDHRDGDKLDNQRHNLRLCSRSQNHANKPKVGGTSIYKGVSWNMRAGKWFAQTKLHGKPIWIGSFFDEIEAAKAYDAKALELFGEFARLNFSR